MSSACITTPIDFNKRIEPSFLEPCCDLDLVMSPPAGVRTDNQFVFGIVTSPDDGDDFAVALGHWLGDVDDIRV